MNEQNVNNIKAQMRKGMLEYCVLLLLSGRRAYPSDIIDALREADMIVVEGTLYTLLNRMRKEEKLSYHWEESKKGPPRKYYTITPYGREVLSAMSDAWEEINFTVKHFRKEATRYLIEGIDLEKTEQEPIKL